MGGNARRRFDSKRKQREVVKELRPEDVSKSGKRSRTPVVPHVPWRLGANAQLLTGNLNISGSCSGFFHSACPQFSAFRTRCQFYNGDYELEVRAGAKSASSFREFLKQSNIQPGRGRTTKALLSCTPAEYLWRFNFGTLYWSWMDASGLRGVYGIGENGTGFLPRIWVHLDPTSKESDVQAAREEALQTLAKMPAALRGGISKLEMAERIREDMDLLQELVAKRGSFGDAVLPDAHSPICEVLMYESWDGNGGAAAFATPEHYLFIRFVTS